MYDVALLDFDGYICKAYYATISRGLTDFDEMLALLEELVKSAKSKVDKYADINYYISGHTYKKDIYPSYKANRKKDLLLGEFREFIKLYYEDKIIKDNVEADDLIIMDYEHYSKTHNPVVFSDDKDLRYYCKTYCKINLSEEIIEQDEKEMEQHRIIQFLTGDKEDNVQGVYGIGEKKAIIELNKLGGITIENVIRVYRNKGVDIDECLKNLILISPLYSKFIEGYYYDDESTLDNIIGLLKYWNKKVKDIYYEMG
jgi:DNA polymerase-1|nr:MAG TPA: Exodeoxyribonuclease [Caudoviricetes sp.]